MKRAFFVEKSALKAGFLPHDTRIYLSPKAGVDMVSITLRLADRRGVKFKKSAGQLRLVGGLFVRVVRVVGHLHFADVSTTNGCIFVEGRENANAIFNANGIISFASPDGTVVCIHGARAAWIARDRWSAYDEVLSTAAIIVCCHPAVMRAGFPKHASRIVGDTRGITTVSWRPDRLVVKLT